ncbi:MAG: YfcC family protein [Bacteroidia bacterium]
MNRPARFPDTTILLLGFLVLFAMLTWLLPAGAFDRQETDGRMTVVPGSYHRVEARPQGPGAVLMAPAKGFVAAGQIIAFVLMVGGAFAILARTGAIEAGLRYVVQVSAGRPGLRRGVIPLLMLAFSLGGATFGLSEEVLVFVWITIPLAHAMGYDTITGVAIAFVGAGVGFAGAFLNPFTVGVAQGIAELPPFSGAGYRLVVWAAMTLLATGYVMRHARRVAQTGPDRAGPETVHPSDPSVAWDGRRKLILVFLLLTLVGLVAGVSWADWYIDEISALFLVMGVGAAFIGRLTVAETLAAFKSGMQEMIAPVLVIALAKGLLIIATDGQIIDTVLQGVASSLGDLPPALSVQIMFLLQSGLNFFVPSGSGQAALTMPIMAPLSDLLGLSRQVAVLAFQFGDGLSNMIIPTSGVTMGVIAIARIPYDVWFRWMLPLFLWLSLLAMLLLLPPVLLFAW